MFRRVLARLRSHWWLWLPVAVALAAANELFDREVAGDKNGHPAADALIALVVVVVGATVWELVSSRSERGTG